MKVPAIKYRVIDNITGRICCVIAVKISDAVNFSPSVIAEKFAHSLEHTSHQTATVHVWEEGEFIFSAGEEVRLVEYSQQPNDFS